MSIQNATQVEETNTYNHSTYDDEACTLLTSTQQTFTEDSADEAMTPADANSEGKGQ